MVERWKKSRAGMTMTMMVVVHYASPFMRPIALSSKQPHITFSSSTLTLKMDKYAGNFHKIVVNNFDLLTWDYLFDWKKCQILLFISSKNIILTFPTGAVCASMQHDVWMVARVGWGCYEPAPPAGAVAATALCPWLIGAKVHVRAVTSEAKQ